MKALLISAVLIWMFSGCSTKVYHDPYLEVTLQDKQTQAPVAGAVLKDIHTKYFRQREMIRSSSTMSEVAVSSDEGVLLKPGSYEKRFHLYPYFLIHSGGALYESEYLLSHPDYSDIIIDCYFLSLSGDCRPEIIYRVADDKKQMQLLWSRQAWRNECILYRLHGRAVYLGADPREGIARFQLDEEEKANIPEKYHDIKIGWNQELHMLAATLQLTGCPDDGECMNRLKIGEHYGAVLETTMDQCSGAPRNVLTILK